MAFDVIRLLLILKIYTLTAESDYYKLVQGKHGFFQKFQIHFYLIEIVLVNILNKLIIIYWSW